MNARSQFLCSVWFCMNTNSTMPEIISGVLKFTFGLLASKARGEIAERLKDGDATHEEFRQLIAENLIKLKRIWSDWRKQIYMAVSFFYKMESTGCTNLFINSHHLRIAESTEVEPASSLIRPKSSSDTVLIQVLSTKPLI